MNNWQAITGRPCFYADIFNWSIDWQIYAHYEKPDGLVPGGDGDFYFINRHIRPDASLDQPLVTRDRKGLDESPLGCHVSAAALAKRPDAYHGGEIFGDRNGRSAHERDWDFLVETREKLLAQAGVPASAGAKEKVEALALFFGTKGYIQDKAKNFTRGFHPVDVLLHGQHCTGQSATLAAFCHTMGIRARALNFAGHSVCEACIDGKYLLFDNQIEEPRAGRSYMETVADPASSQLTDKRCQSYHWLMNTGGERHLVITKGKWPNPVETTPLNHGVQLGWRFNSAGLGAAHRTLGWEGGHGFTLPLTPETAKALYPNEDRYIFKYNAQESCRVSLTLPHTWYAAPLSMREGMAVRKVFWLGSLDGVSSVSSLLAAWPGERWKLYKPYSAGWYLRINGKEFRLRDLKDEPKADLANYGLKITVPINALKENALNEIVIGSDGSGYDFMVLRAYPDMLAPYTPPILRNPVSVAADKVVGTHVCDAYASHIMS